jgi:hypothetical protein
MKKQATKAKRATKDLEPQKAMDVKGGDGTTPTTVSNIMKTRHDTAKNSISNVR